MEVSEKFTDESRCRKLAMSSSFCRRIYSEVEEVGWEHLVKLGEDLTFLSFRVMDNKGRTHILEITLDKTYPRCPPSVSADVPYNFDLKWSLNSKLRDVVQQFQRHVNMLQGFWSTLDDIDRSLWVTHPKNSHHAVSYRQIKVGNDCCIIFSINVDDPISLPECRFLGSDTTVSFLRNKWKQNCKRWQSNNMRHVRRLHLTWSISIFKNGLRGRKIQVRKFKFVKHHIPTNHTFKSRAKDKSFAENLANVFETQLPQPPHLQKNEEQVECGICYAQFLPTDDELGAKSGSATDYKCENGSCNRAFHSVCLVDWLRSIMTTRQSFDVLFGNCPYCSDPIAVKISCNT